MQQFMDRFTFFLIAFLCLFKINYFLLKARGEKRWGRTVENTEECFAWLKKYENC